MRIIRRCKNASIYDEDGKLICNVNASYDEDEDEMFISTPLDFNGALQEEYEIKFFHQVLGVAPCTCTLEKVVPDSEHRDKYFCEIIERGKQIQRRENVKVPVNIDIEIYITKDPEGDSMPPDRLVKATMKDVSAGGIYFISEEMIEPGMFVRFRFNECKANMILTAEVLRAIDLSQKGEGQNFGYGCQFYDIAEHDEEDVRGYVFKVEKELYR